MLIFIRRSSSVLFLVLLAFCFNTPVLKVQAVSRDTPNGEFKNDIPENNDKSEESFYKAAVVEYAADDHPNDFTAEQILFHNVENFEKFMREAGLEGTDIIVFPEYGLTSLTFTRGAANSSEAALMGKRERLQPYLQYIPEIGQNPCQTPGSSEVIKRISCASAANKIYTVINLGEIVPCTDKFNVTTCPDDGNFHFNTAVAFDRNGTIVAKYHKYNLFGEPQFNAAPFPEFSSFLTDFGVEFGMFICFDILFEIPAKALVSRGIRHFVFPTAWVDELPFLTAIQAQSFWSSSSSATLLASGYHSPGFGKLGSGIYSETGKALNYTFDPDSGTKIIYAKVPITTKNIKEQKTTSGILSKTSTVLEEKQMINKNKQQKVDRNSYAENTHWYYRENLTNYTTIPIPMPEKTKGTKETENETEQTHENISVCDKEFCCELTYTLMKSVNRDKESTCESETEIIMKEEKIRNDLEIDEITAPVNQYLQSSILDLSSAHYRLVVINQPRKFSSPIVVQELNLQVCGVVRCLNESVQSCAENYRPSSSSSEDNIPNFSFLQLKASPFSIPTGPNDHETDDNDYNTIPHSKPTFTSLDIYFKLILPHLLNVNYTEESQSLTLTSAEIGNVPIQTLTLFNIVYTKSAA